MATLVYICGSGHSGSTLLDRLLGRYQQIAALGEIHRFSLGLHRFEGPFRCDCGEAIPRCPFWQRVLDELCGQTGLATDFLVDQFQTTDHSVLKHRSGEKYFDAGKRYELFPRDLSKYVIASIPSPFISTADRLGLTGRHLSYARNSLRLFEAVAKEAGVSVVVDSTKNPVRMRALYLSCPEDMRIVYLSRDGRAVANSRMKRQSVTMTEAARIWVAENRKLEWMLRRMPSVPVHYIKYEDLCRDVEGEMARLLRFCDVEPLMRPVDDVRHAVGGNPSRFGSLDIRVDEAWKQDLTPTQLLEFSKAVGEYQPGLPT